MTLGCLSLPNEPKGCCTNEGSPSRRQKLSSGKVVSCPCGTSSHYRAPLFSSSLFARDQHALLGNGYVHQKAYFPHHTILTSGRSLYKDSQGNQPKTSWQGARTFMHWRADGHCVRLCQPG